MTGFRFEAADPLAKAAQTLLVIPVVEYSFKVEVLVAAFQSEPAEP